MDASTDRPITVRFSADKASEIEEAAAAEERTTSSLIRHAVNQYLREKE